MDQEGPIYVDQNDPNYDSDLDGNGFVLEELNLTELKKEMQQNDVHGQKNESVGGMATSPPMGKGPGSDSGDSSSSSAGKKNEDQGRGEKKDN